MWNFNLLNKILLFFSLVFVFSLSPAQAASSSIEEITSAKAQVLKIINTADVLRENGQKTVQQDLELGILDGPLKGQIVQYHGISDIDVVVSNIYDVGDKVIVNYSRGEDGEYVFFITDYVRGRGLQWLLFIFIATVLLVGGRKGFFALLSLFASFFIIIKLLVPLVLKGYNPLVVGVLMSFIIMLAIIYLTEGWNRRSHVAILSITASLLVTAILSVIFTYLNKLTGTSQEEIIYILDAVKQPINFRSLLLASFVIGTLGVLDDVVIGQIESVNQIKSANPNLKPWKIFQMSMEIGKSHLSAIINTLFLAYVSASFPLILLFSLHNAPFLTFGQIINNEDVATEIVRTLVGVVGLCAAVPIATACAVKFINPSKHERKN